MLDFLISAKQEIMTFLQRYELRSLEHLNCQEKYKKIRTKLFNDRKDLRKSIENMSL